MLRKPYRTITQDNGTLNIYGNNHRVEIISGWQLTDKEKKEFDYLEGERLDDASFFRYKGNVYDLGDIERVDKYAPAWMQEYDGIANDSFFSGILIKYDAEDNEYIRVYTFIG